MDCSPPGSSVHGILQARILDWVAISFSNAWKWKVKGKSLSRVRLLATPWTAAHQKTIIWKDTCILMFIVVLFTISKTAMRYNQSILKEISPGCSLELMLKLKLQYFGHLMRRVDSLEKTLMLGGIGGRRRRGRQRTNGWMASPTWRTWVWVNAGSWWWIGRPDVLQSIGFLRVGHDWTTGLNYLNS